MAQRKGSGKPSRKQPAAASPKRPGRPVRTLASVVGPQTYAVWVEMLRTLVPHGRTHRLSVLVAAMLRHAADVAQKSGRRRVARGSVAASLLSASEEADPVAVADELGDVLVRLFRDARVSGQRVNARGVPYSVLDSAIAQFVAWEMMPWE